VTLGGAGTGFAAVRTVGTLLPADLLARVVAGGDLAGLRSEDYHLAGEPLRQAASRAYEYLRGVHARFADELARRPAGDAATGLTRERWLLPLLRALDYGPVPATPGKHLTVEGRDYPVSHLWADVPVHLLGWGIDLDAGTSRVAGAARAPQSMVQELLNRSAEHLWAVLSNGRTLRLLRDSSALVGQSYVEFDLQAIFDGELFSDFVLLYLLCHESRLERLAGADGQPGGTADRWLERWRTDAIDTGARALTALSGQVRQALEALGSGFLRHPDNEALRERLANGQLPLADYNRALLRVVYRLLFWFVAEDRRALLDPVADRLAVERYDRWFSAARLRRIARRRLGSRHADVWARVRLVLDGLGREGGRPELGLPGLGGLFETGPLDVTDGCALHNETVHTVVRLLSTTTGRQAAVARAVDFRNLGAEELGGIYESLLELHPRHDPAAGTFTLAAAAGNERKASGSYYTPTSLIDCLLDTALDPLIDDVVKATEDGGPRAAALLKVTVCDPAMGSGHFLVAAARRIARRVAEARAGDPEPAPAAVQAALRDVVTSCIHGVDVNPMAVELAKVSLWLEGLEAGRPLAFLDANLRLGNALLGTTPALLARGVPDAAFKPLAGDDRATATALGRRNRLERAGTDDLFAGAGIPVGNARLAADTEALRGPTRSLADVHVAARRNRELEDSAARLQARLVADAWCAAFVQEKTPHTAAVAVTDAVLRGLAHDPGRASPETLALVRDAAERYRFFHWHVEFPDIFAVPDSGPAATETGWTGGFTCVVGNPPWERVKLQEQEFFAERDPNIAGARNAAARGRLIAALPITNPVLDAVWRAAGRQAEAQSALLRLSGRYPLTGRGDVNTYSVFTETMRATVSDTGRAGVITPTGLATDATTAPFFADTLGSRRLAAFYDFDNEAKIFAGVHHSFRFALTVMTGRAGTTAQIDFAFLIRHLADLPLRRFPLAPDEVLLLNPNTGTLPVFRTRFDADITLGVYKRHPVLVRDDGAGGNPWAVDFGTLFHMANDSGLFSGTDDLREAGADFDGWAFVQRDQRWLPLYEAKLLSHYDSRFSTYAGATQEQLNVGSLPRLTDSQHDDPAVEPLARYWVAENEVDRELARRWSRGWFLAVRRLTRSSDQRTLIPSVVPRTGAGDSAWIVLSAAPENLPLLQAALSSMVADYIVRQKLSGTTLSSYYLEQTACPTPATFDTSPRWVGVPLRDIVLPRVLELSYTNHRIASYARDLGDDGPPFHWVPERRAMLRAELDAVMLHVYGLSREEAEHVLDSFPVVRRYEERDLGEFRTKRLVLESYDAMAGAAASEVPWRSPLLPTPGHGPRHDSRSTE